MTANDRHAIPPFPPSHATVPSPDKLSQHTFQFVDAQRLFRDQFVALVDDELRLGELRKRILRLTLPTKCVNDVTLAAKRWRCVRLRRC